MTESQVAYLDLVRGIAAQLVLIGHVMGASGKRLPVTIQDLGVAVFFILSGFLITRSACTKSSFNEYFIDRFARIYTAYAPSLVFILVVGYIFDLGGPLDWKTFVANFLLLNDVPLHHVNLPPFDRLGTGRPLWSVSLEWWLYMGFGTLYFARRLPIWAYPRSLIGLYVTATQAVGGSLSFVWASGALAFVAVPRLPQTLWLPLAGFFFLVCLKRYGLVHGKSEELSAFYDLQLALLIACVFFCGYRFLETKKFPRWLSKFSKLLSSYSFSLYLTHYTIMVAFRDLDGWTRILVVFAVSNLIAYTLYYAFERNHVRVRDWIKRKTIYRTQ